MDKVSASEYRQWILTFRLKYVFVAGKIIRTARQTILKFLEGYPYKEAFHKKLLKNKTCGQRRAFKTDYLWIV